MARILDGGTEQIDYGDILDLTLFTDWSYSIRFYVDAFGTAFQTLVSKGDGSWRVGRVSSSATIDTSNGRFNTHIAVGTAGSVDDGNPHTAVSTFDDSTNTLEFWVDGASEGTSATGTKAINTTHNVAIGENIEAGSREWEGKISEFIFYSILLSDAKVGALESGVPPFIIDDQSVEFYAPMYGNDSSEPDYSGNGNVGTLSGTAKFNHSQVEHLENYI